MDVQEQIDKFQEFIETNCIPDLHKLIEEGKKSLLINFAELSEFDPDLAESLLTEPDELIKAAELALDQFDFLEKKQIRIRFFNLPNSQEFMIRDIRSIHIDKLITIIGLVRQTSDVRPQISSARFECPACGANLTLLQVDTRFKEPNRCTCGRVGKFRLLSKELIDVQRLVVEEIPELLEGGEQPKRFSVFLKEDMVEPKLEKKTTPGSKVRVNGVVKEVPVFLKTGAQSTRYDLVMEANYIEPIEITFGDIDLSKKDEKIIKNLAKDPQIYQKLVHSIAPSIYGHDNVKEALILQMVGGVSKTKEDGTKTRGDIHVLLVGDPGSGKSVLLTSISKIVPKGRLVSGKGATASGLTATVVKDEFLRGWALEAGALVLANGGTAIIDEFDKMSQEDRSALHEAMEQQRISIAKANIHAVLKAETSILAAANPKFGRFDPTDTIASQIDLPPTLISRFDLIFPIRDVPNREADEKIASHILKLQKEPDSVKAVISPATLRKYVAYVKQQIAPKLTDEALTEIKNFYLKLRNTGTSGEAIPTISISARQLEALVRLSEGSAKIRCAEKVEKEDAQKAISILLHCLEAVGMDYKTGKIDIDKIVTGIPSSQRNQIFIIKEIIDNLSGEGKEGKRTVSFEDVLNRAEEKGVPRHAIEEIIDKMKRSGDIFEPKRGFLQKI